jgi:hypothetical protein
MIIVFKVEQFLRGPTRSNKVERASSAAEPTRATQSQAFFHYSSIFQIIPENSPLHRP